MRGTCALARFNYPLRMLLGIIRGPANGVIDGGPDANFVVGVDLLAKQIELEIRMSLANARGIVRPAMMAFGKDSNGIDIPDLESFLKVSFIEVGAHAVDMLARVEIEMDLPCG